MIATIEIIKELEMKGFTDVSSDKNGLSYRKSLNNKFEICWYVGEASLRLQTKASGCTMYLKGIETIEDLEKFWLLITKENL